MSSKLSKIYSIKQQKKYKNQTINLLNHINHKINTPTLADKSLHSFKSIKPQVQSSRLNRPQTAKILAKNSGYVYNGTSKQRQKIQQSIDKYKQKTNDLKLNLETAIDRYNKISSKSLQARQGSNHTHRRESDKTKKNSYARLQTQPMGVDNQVNFSKEDDRYGYIYKKLKAIYNILMTQNRQEIKYYPSTQKQNLQLQTQMVKLKVHTKSKSNFIHPNNNINTNINMKNIVNNNNPKQYTYQSQYNNVNSAQMIKQLQNKFNTIKQNLQPNNNKCHTNSQNYLQINHLLLNIINTLHNSFSSILSHLLKQNQQKLLDIEMTIIKMLNNHEEQIHIQIKKHEKIKQFYMQQMQGMLIKSLYMTDKINILQQKGIINFQKYARKLDQGQGQEVFYNQFIEENNLYDARRDQSQNQHQYQKQDEYSGKNKFEVRYQPQDRQHCAHSQLPSVRRMHRKDDINQSQFQQRNNHNQGQLIKPPHKTNTNPIMIKPQNKLNNYGYIHSVR